MIQSRWRGLKGDKGDTGAAGPGMTSGARHAVIFLFVFALVLSAMNLLWTSMQVNNLRAQVLTECMFDADIGSAPVVVAASGKPSLLGVRIISDSRMSWHGHHCPGRLAPAAPSFAHWAREFHLPVG